MISVERIYLIDHTTDYNIYSEYISFLDKQKLNNKNKKINPR
jgi:hypothetical protein